MKINAHHVIEDKLQQAVKAGHPFAEQVMIDAKLASELLKRNRQNRPLRERRAERYREDMTAGDWSLNGQPVIIGADGSLLDGQHRMEAIAGTDLIVPMFIVWGVDPASRITVDQGAPRNAGDYLRMRGEETAPTAASIVRLRLAYERNERVALKDTMRPTNAQILHYFDKHKPNVLESAKLATELNEYSRPLVAPAVLGFVHNVLHEIEPNAANEYIEKVAKGEDISEGCPAFAVRTRLLKMGKTGAAKKAGVLFTGWNAYRAGRPLKTVRATGSLPTVA